MNYAEHGVFIYLITSKRDIFAAMTKRLVDIDDDALQQARTALGDVTIKEAVNTGLREICDRHKRRRLFRSIQELARADLGDADVMHGAWLQAAER